jgi:hypothetical protein
VRDLIHLPHATKLFTLSTPTLDLSPYDNLLPSRRKHVENHESADPLTDPLNATQSGNNGRQLR